jgi:hypothetical protein
MLVLFYPNPHLPYPCQVCGKACKPWKDGPEDDEADVWTLQRKYNVLYHQPSNIGGVVCMSCNRLSNSNEARDFDRQRSATIDSPSLDVIREWYAGHGGPAAHAAENRPPDDEFAEWAIDPPQECECARTASTEEIVRQLRHCFIFMLRHNGVGPFTTARICKATISKFTVARHWRKFTQWKNINAIIDADVDDYLTSYTNDPLGRKPVSNVVIRRITCRRSMQAYTKF